VRLSHRAAVPCCSSRRSVEGGWWRVSQSSLH
jgi:hypothetical protein